MCTMNVCCDLGDVICINVDMLSVNEIKEAFYCQINADFALREESEKLQQ